MSFNHTGTRATLCVLDEHFKQLLVVLHAIRELLRDEKVQEDLGELVKIDDINRSILFAMTESSKIQDYIEMVETMFENLSPIQLKLFEDEQ